MWKEMQRDSLFKLRHSSRQFPLVAGKTYPLLVTRDLKLTKPLPPEGQSDS